VDWQSGVHLTRGGRVAAGDLATDHRLHAFHSALVRNFLPVELAVDLEVFGEKLGGRKGRDR